MKPHISAALHLKARICSSEKSNGTAKTVSSRSSPPTSSAISMNKNRNTNKIFTTNVVNGQSHNNELSDSGLFSGFFCYRKTVARTQTLTEFQNSILITKYFPTLQKYLLLVYSNIYYYFSFH